LTPVALSRPRRAAAECVADLPERVPVSLPVLVGVRLQGDCKPGVPEDELGVTGRDPAILQGRRGGVPQVMQRDDPELVDLADALERADEVPRLDRPACPGAEDKPGVLPGAAKIGAVGGLASARITSTSLACWSSGRSRRPAAVLTGPIHRLPLTRRTCWRTRISSSSASMSRHRSPRTSPSKPSHGAIAESATVALFRCDRYSSGRA
jgi:hypothetical protein